MVVEGRVLITESFDTPLTVQRNYLVEWGLGLLVPVRMSGGPLLPLVIAAREFPYRREIRVQQVVLDTNRPRQTVRISGGQFTVHISRPTVEGEGEGQPLDQRAILELIRTSTFLTTSVGSALLGEVPVELEPDWSGIPRVCESGGSAE